MITFKSKPPPPKEVALNAAPKRGQPKAPAKPAPTKRSKPNSKSDLENWQSLKDITTRGGGFLIYIKEGLQSGGVFIPRTSSKILNPDVVRGIKTPPLFG